MRPPPRSRPRVLVAWCSFFPPLSDAGNQPLASNYSSEGRANLGASPEGREPKHSGLGDAQKPVRRVCPSLREFIRVAGEFRPAYPHPAPCFLSDGMRHNPTFSDAFPAWNPRHPQQIVFPITNSTIHRTNFLPHFRPEKKIYPVP